MAFPPATLPTNRTNATPQNNTHPADHNAISAAVNDTVGALSGLIAAVGPFNLGALGAPSIPGAATQAVVSYSSLSNASWGTGNPFVAPSGTFGYFLFVLKVTGPVVAGAGERVRIMIDNPAGTWANYIPAAETGGTLVCGCSLAPGDQVWASIKTPATQVGAANYTVRFEMVRVAY